MSKPLAGKIALVTGASGAIGSAVARRLAAHGGAVLVHYGSGRVAAGLREARLIRLTHAPTLYPSSSAFRRYT